MFRPHRLNRLHRPLLITLVALVMLALVAQPSLARTPKAPHKYSAKIEPLASYVGQETCSPAAKPGTTAFANLLLRTYPATRSLGISRACSAGGKSEHKEGRAWDWGANVSNAEERASVEMALTWLLATDRHGNEYAMARRLGIQYIIWNRRIWGAYNAEKGWRPYTGASPHTDHVHFSMSWAGARKKTSFWNPKDFPNGSVGPSKPAPTDTQPGTTEPKPKTDRITRPEGKNRNKNYIAEVRPRPKLRPGAPLEREIVRLNVRRPAGKLTRRAVQAGEYYLLEVSGQYRYKKRPRALADGECSRTVKDNTWRRYRSVRSGDRSDHLDVYADGRNMFGAGDDGSACDRNSTYRWVFHAQRTGRIPLQVWDPNSHKDNKGRLKVRVTRMAPKSAMSWTVPSRVATGTTSPGILLGGSTYEVTVSGTWSDPSGRADAVCRRRVDGTWVPARDVATPASDGGAAQSGLVAGWLDPRWPTPRGTWVDRWAPSGMTAQSHRDGRSSADCSADNTYTFVIRTEGPQPLNMRVLDPSGHRDNRGGLKVSVRRVTTPTTPDPTTPTPSPEPPAGSGTEVITLDSASRHGASTVKSYPAGTKLKISARGIYQLRGGRNAVLADASCATYSGRDEWRTDLIYGWSKGWWWPLGDVRVNDRYVDWVPASGNGSCDTNAHYSINYTVPATGQVKFTIADDDFSDNTGALTLYVEVR